jgi:hypothetical protein
MCAMPSTWIMSHGMAGQQAARLRSVQILRTE